MFQRVRTLLLIGLMAVLGMGCNSSQPMGDVASGPATGEAAHVEAVGDRAFAPATLELPAGETVTIQVTNNDSEAHDFAVDAAELNTGTIEPGGVATATFTIAEGTTTFVCTFHPEMAGTIQGSRSDGCSDHHVRSLAGRADRPPRPAAAAPATEVPAAHG